MSTHYNHIVVLTGAGISAESGLATFRGNNGMWGRYAIEDVASIEGFERNPDKVFDFYNELKPKMDKALPNAAHYALSCLQKEYGAASVDIITQNVDLLHEKAGNQNVYHIHGRIDETMCLHCGFVARNLPCPSSSSICPNCQMQGMMKPHIVFFGEEPLYMNQVEHLLSQCDLFIAIGTSGVVYPAAGFVQSAKYANAQTYLFNLDVGANDFYFDHQIIGKASKTIPQFVEKLIKAKA